MGYHDHRGFCDRTAIKEEIEAVKNITIPPLPSFPMLNVNHVRRVAPTGEFIDNGVPQENIQDHLEYNLMHRFDQALFVNGFCVWGGELPKEVCQRFEETIKGLEIQVSPSQLPYK